MNVVDYDDNLLDNDVIVVVVVVGGITTNGLMMEMVTTTNKITAGCMRPSIRLRGCLIYYFKLRYDDFMIDIKK